MRAHEHTRAPRQVYSNAFFFEYTVANGWKSDAALARIGIGCWHGPPSPPSLPPPQPAAPPAQQPKGWLPPNGLTGKCAWDTVQKCYPSTGTCAKKLCQCCSRVETAV